MKIFQAAFDCLLKKLIIWFGNKNCIYYYMQMMFLKFCVHIEMESQARTTCITLKLWEHLNLFLAAFQEYINTYVINYKLVCCVHV